MKRIFLIIFLLAASISFAQNTDHEPTKVYTLNQYLYNLYENTINVLRTRDPYAAAKLDLIITALGSSNTNLDSLLYVVDKITGTNLRLDSLLALATPRVFYSERLIGVDTVSYNFSNNYLKGYLTVYDSTATADTLVIEHYSPTKGGWTQYAIGLRDQLTDLLEADNTTIIVGAGITKTYEINYLRPGNIRVRWKTNAGKSASTKATIGFTGIN